jgi:hypothetical protein
MVLYSPLQVKLHALTLALGDGWSVLCPGHFISRESLWYLLDRRLGGHQSHSGHDEEKNPITTGNQIQAVQPIASNFTDQVIALMTLYCTAAIFSEFFYKIYIYTSDF